MGCPTVLFELNSYIYFLGICLKQIIVNMHIACSMCLLYFAYVTPRDLVNCPYGINKVSEMEIEILSIYAHLNVLTLTLTVLW